jgi:hypothetical protein
VSESQRTMYRRYTNAGQAALDGLGWEDLHQLFGISKERAWQMVKTYEHVRTSRERISSRKTQVNDTTAPGQGIRSL